MHKIDKEAMCDFLFICFFKSYHICGNSIDKLRSWGNENKVLNIQSFENLRTSLIVIFMFGFSQVSAT